MVGLGRDGRWCDLFGCNAGRRPVQRTSGACTTRRRSYRTRGVRAGRYSSLRHFRGLYHRGAESVAGQMCCMGKRIFLTGRAGCGKTTLIQRVVRDLALPAGGFYTKEIRERSVRVGFKLITLEAKEAVFADVNFKTSERLGKYGLDLAKLETVGVAEVREALRARKLLVIDEIGPKEIRSALFRDVITETFETTVPILATFTARLFPFTNELKNRPMSGGSAFGRTIANNLSPNCQPNSISPKNEPEVEK